MDTQPPSDQNPSGTTPVRSTAPAGRSELRSEIDELIDEDALFSFLKRWSNVITIVLIAVGVIFLYQYQSEKAFQVAMQESARVMREGLTSLAEYEELLAERETLQRQLAGTYTPAADEEIPAPEKLEELLSENKAALESAVTLVEGKFDVLAQSRGGYGPIGRAFQAVLLAKEGKIEEAQSRLADLDWKVQAPATSQRMYFELAALRTARSMLDYPDHRATGREQLVELAQQGTVAHVPAGLTLASIAETQEEKEEVRQLLESIIEGYPEQAELLERELEALR